MLGVLNKEWSRQKEQRAAQDRETPAPDAMFAVDVASDVKAGQVDGPPDAAVTIVKAFDFACPYCQQASPTMKELVKDYDKVVLAKGEKQFRSKLDAKPN
ncbi:MAG TPA: thioredoxin domain-containing protein [Kofleriaceae bacterium]